MSLGLFFVVCLIVSGLVIRIGMALMARFGVLDHPGGHKQHDASTPFVGGFGIVAVMFAVLAVGAALFPELSALPLRVIVLGAAVLFVTGFADDIWHLSFKIRFVIQALVAVAMVVLGGVGLSSLGELLPRLSADMGMLAIPFTIFATVGLINALNMIDGIDGLSGSLSFTSMAGIAMVAVTSGQTGYLVMAVALMGGLAGFLYFNLRYPGNLKARVFMGDNGSMLLGFVFAWMLIGLSQGQQAAMAPVTALWLFGVPLLDTVSVMLRRVWLGKSPFHADRHHLHHLFLRAGFRVSDTVRMVILVQALLVAIGLAGEYFNVPEYLMFGAFLMLFASYFYVIFRPWRVVPNLRRLNAWLGLPSVAARGVFVGYFSESEAKRVLSNVIEDLGRRFEYRISLHTVDNKALGRTNVFALVELDEDVNEATIGATKALMVQIKEHLSYLPKAQVRLFMHRNGDNDRRADPRRQNDEVPKYCIRDGERRSSQGSTVFYEVEYSVSKKEADAVRV